MNLFEYILIVTSIGLSTWLLTEHFKLKFLVDLLKSRIEQQEDLNEKIMEKLNE